MSQVNDCPDKADQFCGNFKPNAQPPRIIGETLTEAQAREREWLAKMYFGPPKATLYISSEEMLKWEWVGLYLREDCDLSKIDKWWPVTKKLLEDIACDE
jgi:hypothetical protein